MTALDTVSPGSGLRTMMGVWAFAAFLPLPALTLTDPAIGVPKAIDAISDVIMF